MTRAPRTILASIAVIAAVGPVGCGDEDSGPDASDFKPIEDLPEVFSYGTVHSFAPDDVWVSADSGRLFHFDGTVWSETVLDTSEQMRAACGFAPDNLWMVGGQTLAQYDGTNWTVTDMSLIDAGVEGLEAIWASAPDDVWVVGTRQSTVAHFDGTNWQRYFSASSENTAVWGSAPDDVYIAGRSSVERWDGTDFIELDRDLSAAGIWGFGPDDVWLADDDRVNHFDGNEWTEVDVDGFFGASTLWGLAPDDLWGVGDFGSIVHYDGTRWREVAAQGLGSPYLRVFSRIHGSAQGDVWTLGSQSGEGGVIPLLWRYIPD